LRNIKNGINEEITANRIECIKPRCLKNFGQIYAKAFPIIAMKIKCSDFIFVILMFNSASNKNKTKPLIPMITNNKLKYSVNLLEGWSKSGNNE
jgi:hypothetical protein